LEVEVLWKVDSVCFDFLFFENYLGLLSEEEYLLD
tara:strand:- start:51 stop:155 length:105 start_codon:yes stop_codon:yes gene_type:complete